MGCTIDIGPGGSKLGRVRFLDLGEFSDGRPPPIRVEAQRWIVIIHRVAQWLGQQHSLGQICMCTFGYAASCERARASSTKTTSRRTDGPTVHETSVWKIVYYASARRQRGYGIADRRHSIIYNPFCAGCDRYGEQGSDPS